MPPGRQTEQRVEQLQLRPAQRPVQARLNSLGLDPPGGATVRQRKPRRREQRRATPCAIFRPGAAPGHAVLERGVLPLPSPPRPRPVKTLGEASGARSNSGAQPHSANASAASASCNECVENKAALGTAAPVRISHSRSYCLLASFLLLGCNFWALFWAVKINFLCFFVKQVRNC